MASAPSSFSAPNVFQLISVKLDGSNYLNWVSQFLPVLRSNNLLGFVDGTEPCPEKFLSSSDGKETAELNPAFLLWNKKDQFVLSCINASLTDKVLSYVYGMDTAQKVWQTLAKRYASPSRSRINLLQTQLQNLQQGSKSCSELLYEVKGLTDQLLAIGKSFVDDDLIGYVQRALNPSFNPFIVSCSFALRTGVMSFEDFQSELLAYEILLAGQSSSIEQPGFAMVATQNGGQKQYKNKPRGPYVPKASPQSPSSKFMPGFPPTTAQSPAVSNARGPPSTNQVRTACQICGKTNHSALDCYHRMDYAYQGRHPPAQLAAMVAQTNALADRDTWILDSGANQHITSDLANLSFQEPYMGKDAVAVGNGQEHGAHVTGGEK